MESSVKIMQKGAFARQCSKEEILGNSKAGKSVGKSSDPAGAMSMSAAASFANSNPAPK